MVTKELLKLKEVEDHLNKCIDILFELDLIHIPSALVTQRRYISNLIRDIETK
jgi:hypothetical protein